MPSALAAVLEGPELGQASTADAKELENTSIVGRVLRARQGTYGQHDPIREQSLEGDGHGESRVELVRKAGLVCRAVVVNGDARRLEGKSGGGSEWPGCGSVRPSQHLSPFQDTYTKGSLHPPTALSPQETYGFGVAEPPASE